MFMKDQIRYRCVKSELNTGHPMRKDRAIALSSALIYIHKLVSTFIQIVTKFEQGKVLKVCGGADKGDAESGPLLSESHKAFHKSRGETRAHLKKGGGGGGRPPPPPPPKCTPALPPDNLHKKE